jgi:hemolysin III
VDQLHSVPLALIVTGGALYTVGAVIYALRRPNPWPRVFGFHEIFHVFVILAAIAPFVAMAAWIVPSGLGD